MEDRSQPREMTKEVIINALKELEPGTMLIIDLPEEGKGPGYAEGIQSQKGDGKDGGKL